MAISLFLGRDNPGDRNDLCYETIQAFMEKFAAKFGAVNCYVLTGVHLDTPEGQAAFKKKEQNKLCTEYVAGATGLVMQLVKQFETTHDRRNNLPYQT